MALRWFRCPLDACWTNLRVDVSTIVCWWTGWISGDPIVLFKCPLRYVLRKRGQTHSPNHQSRNNTCGLKVMSGLWRLLRPGWVGYKRGTNSTLWFLKGAFKKRCFHFVPWIGREKLIHIVSILPSRLQWTWMVTGFDSYRAISDQTHFSMTWEAAHEQEILC